MEMIDDDSRGFSAQCPGQGGNDQKCQENEKKDLRDTHGCSGDAPKAENAGDDGEDEKGDCPT